MSSYPERCLGTLDASGLGSASRLKASVVVFASALVALQLNVDGLIPHVSDKLNSDLQHQLFQSSEMLKQMLKRGENFHNPFTGRSKIMHEEVMLGSLRLQERHKRCQYCTCIC